MDLSTITDIKELKALAYDQLSLREQCDRNLVAINQRMNEANEISLKPSKTKK